MDVPLRSFVPEIQNKDQFYSSIVNNVEGGDIDNNNRSINITDPHTLQLTLPRFDERQKLKMVTLYSLRIRMGSIGRQPRVCQFHFTFRAIINHDQNMLVEYVLNYDRVYRVYNGYRFYTNNPQLFINMIETHKSFDESKALYNMMADDGIIFNTDIPLDLTDWMHSNQHLMMSYANCNLFFFYLLNRRVLWQSTPNYSIFENWCRDDIHFFPISSGGIAPEDFISLVPGIINPPVNLSRIKNYISRSDIRILADDGLDTFSNADFNIRQIDRVYHKWFVHWNTQDYDNTVAQYELMVRMRRIKQKPVYIELIITFEHVKKGLGYMPKKGVMFVTEDQLLFTLTFLTGNKQKICNFIRKDEGLWLSPPPPPPSLLDKCTRRVVDQLIENREVHVLDKWVFVCGERRTMFPQYWRLGVDDIYKRHHLFDTSRWPFNSTSMIRTGIGHIFNYIDWNSKICIGKCLLLLEEGELRTRISKSNMSLDEYIRY